MIKLSTRDTTEFIQSQLNRTTRPLIVALDGRSGVGKSTFSQTLKENLGAAVITCDDFYSGGEDKSWINKAVQEKVEKVIDWRRIRDDVLLPLRANKTATWHSINWETMSGLSAHAFTQEPQPLIVLDGAYSARPELSDLLDITILLQHPDLERRKRLVAREGKERMTSWHSVWDEAEEYYFAEIMPPEKFDVVVQSETE